MSIAISEEHEFLARTVRRWLDSHCPPQVPRVLLDADREELQPVWKELAAQGWLGIHIPETWGGQGHGLYELAVVLEETGRSLLPGPLLPTVVVSAAIAETGTPAQCGAFLPGLTDGSSPAAVHLGGSHLDIVRRFDDGSIDVSGHLRPVLGAATASMALVPARDGDGPVIWCLLDAERSPDDSLDGSPDGLSVRALSSLDPTRGVGEVGAGAVRVSSDRQFPSMTRARITELAVALAAAEQVGGARWCLETASEYAKVRRQFGRPIGQFQAVKHRLADMLVETEQMTAVAWDAALAVGAGGTEGAALAAATAGAIVLDGYVENAKACLQILGGVGFTWEHDVQLHLKRATATRQLFGRSDAYRTEVATLARAGVRRTLVTDLPDAAERVRSELAPLIGELKLLDGEEQRRKLVDAGLVVPHWPSPWGRDATAVEQLVIDEDLAAAGIGRPHIGVGAWALPAIIAHGTDRQRERWMVPTLLGNVTWCQLFSEPGAGSDLAGLSSRAERADGGWSLTGQKVWTSLAHRSDWAICLARTNRSARKHEGITYFIVDMHSPGVDVRPLRELTGDAMFNEVFLDSVFVPDDCVIGAEGQGWEITRMTLANERVSISSGSTFGVGVEALIRLVERSDEPVTPSIVAELGALLAEAQALRLMTHRSTLRSLAASDSRDGGVPAAMAGTSVRKLLGAEHEQRVQELGLAMVGPEGSTMEGSARRWAHGFLVTRCLTIAGGTSEVQRNVIAERILGLPRDPEPEQG